jgi:hypothetical protein
MPPPIATLSGPPRAGLCLLACAILYGCGDGGQALTAAPAPPEPEPTAAPEPQPTSIEVPEVVTPLWQASRVLDAFSLTLTDEARGPEVVLRMTCRPDRSFSLESQRLTHIPSEERLTVGVGSTVLTLVATAMPEGDGVQASGPIDTALLGDIGVGHPLQANYGAQNLGPIRPAARPLLARFVLACRNYARP